ncbi:MAG: hypothetical protein AAFR27_10145 [Pseudomonadota bacterium]
MRAWKYLQFFAVFVLLAAGHIASALGQVAKANIYDELTIWYAAHADGIAFVASNDAVNAALAPMVMIELKSLDIVQNKAEYLDSFEVWREAIEGGLVAHRVDAVEGSIAYVTVCYVFEGNSSLTNETIAFNDDMQITSLVSEELADSCEAF